MANFKVAGAGIVITFVTVFLEVIFIPMINTNLVTLKTSAPDASTNSTLLNTQKILFILPLFTVIGGLVVSAGAGVMMGKK